MKNWADLTLSAKVWAQKVGQFRPVFWLNLVCVLPVAVDPTANGRVRHADFLPEGTRRKSLVRHVALDRVADLVRVFHSAAFCAVPRNATPYTDPKEKTIFFISFWLDVAPRGVYVHLHTPDNATPQEH